MLINCYYITTLNNLGNSFVLWVKLSTIYYEVPISRACTVIYLGGNVALHGLIMHCTLINFRKCGLHVFYLDHFL